MKTTTRLEMNPDGTGVASLDITDGAVVNIAGGPGEIANYQAFIDEGWLTPDFYAVYYGRERWWDQPGLRHNEGVTLSFADGHSEHWKWQDSRTKEMCRMEWSEFEATWWHKPCPDNEDLFKVRRAAWGDLGD